MEPTSERGERTVRAVLFDVDGTLVDSNYLHAVTWWEAFRQSGYVVGMADIHRSIGMGSDKLLDHLLGEDRDRSGDGKLSDAHSALYGTYHERLQPLPGARELLFACAERGLRVVLASSASSPELAAMRRALDAEEAVHAATGAADVESSKPAPDLVERALDEAGVVAEEALFVGDTVWDMRACAKADVPAVAVLTGGLPEADLREAGAERVYPGPSAVLDDLDTLLGWLKSA